MQRIIFFLIVGVIIFFSYILTPLVNLITDFWWFSALEYESVFLTMLWAKLGVGAIFTVLLFGVLYGNLLIAFRVTSKEMDNFDQVFGESAEMLRHNFKMIVLLVALFFSFVLSKVAVDEWIQFLQYFNQSTFNIADPVFNKDISFFVFSLPIYMFVNNWLMMIGILTLISLTALYFFRGALSTFRGRLYFSSKARTHLFILGLIILLIKSWDYLLEAYRLVVSRRWLIFGASYTDVNALLWAYQLLAIIALFGAIAFGIGILRRSWRPPIFAIVALFIFSALFGRMIPTLLQNYVVEPTELQKETPFLKENIKYTRLAYNLDKIESDHFPAEESLTADDIEQNDLTVSNIRLWDKEPLQQTYRQLQEIRLYYDFHDVDIDRYTIEDDFEQIMLSLRELSYDSIPNHAKTWINKHFQYTHGYGACVSPVNRVSQEGLPEFLIKDIPPESRVASLQIDRPEIYYGESTNYFILVKCKDIQEFDYPKGDTNQLTTYNGQGGVSIGSFFRRIIFTLKWRSLKILFTNYLTDESRIMYYRQIKERVGKLAPFIAFDQNPYPIIVDGRIFWIMDGYTTTGNFPYSTPFLQGINHPYSSQFRSHQNYIRNPVKVVIDAFHGSVDFYISDPNDPLIQTYDRIFDQMFKPIEEMPVSVREHIRYPQDMFRIQSEMLATYHMEDPQVFYNKEDLWSIPREIYDGKEQLMNSYYLIMKLPRENDAEMIQLLPFTPTNKDNMIAWFCARCDGDDYGKLLLYKFPKKKLTYGPMQIEARIDQDTDISQLMTLWSQQGSRVIRGNLLVIPIETSLLYVEPIYLQAETGQLPELKRVIVSYANRVVMEKSLRDALEVIFKRAFEDTRAEAEIRLTPAIIEQTEQTIKQLADAAWGHYQDALNRAKNNDWAGYGQKMDDLEQTLKKLQETITDMGNRGK